LNHSDKDNYWKTTTSSPLDLAGVERAKAREVIQLVVDVAVKAGLGATLIRNYMLSQLYYRHWLNVP